MPELPEVETIRRGLEPELVGAKITGLWTSGKPLRLARPLDAKGLRAAVVDHRIDGLRRRAKYMLMDVGSSVVLVHLGMSGRLVLTTVDEPRAPHTHVIWELGRGRELRFVDPRRFGTILHARRVDEDALPELVSLGPDPLADTWDPAALADALTGARTPVKACLLDQSRVSGLGNIYVCEALWQARIHPRTLGHRVRARAPELHAAIQDVLRRALDNRGTSLRDYVDSIGQRGENQLRLNVYAQEGRPCPRGDGGIVRRVVDSGRSTFYCPRCQR